MKLPHQLPEDVPVTQEVLDFSLENFFFFFLTMFPPSVLKQMILVVGTQLRNWVACWVPY